MHASYRKIKSQRGKGEMKRQDYAGSLLSSNQSDAPPSTGRGNTAAHGRGGVEEASPLPVLMTVPEKQVGFRVAGIILTSVPT